MEKSYRKHKKFQKINLKKTILSSNLDLKHHKEYDSETLKTEEGETGN